jgi:hypothetical protein
MFQQTRTDPARLAESVRDLAVEARRILSSPVHHPHELHDLSRRIGVIREQVPGRPATELSRWLETLSRHVETRRRVDRPVASAFRPSSAVADN